MTDFTCTHHHSSTHRLSILVRLRRWRALAQQRHHLAGLSPEQLADIGVNQAEATLEAARPPWDVPAHWRD